MGEGVPVRFSFGEAGYKEMVDFGETIGIHVMENTRECILTSLGEIHYNKVGGYHIVPINPNKIQKLTNKRKTKS